MTDIVHPVHDTNCMKTINSETQTSNDSDSNSVNNTMSEISSVSMIESISRDNNEIIEDMTQSFSGIQKCVEHKENLLNCDSDSDTFEGANSSFDDESEIDDFFMQTSDDELSFNDKESFNEDKRIMFPSSNLTVSNVVLMLKAFVIAFGSTREQKIALINLIKYLAGPQFSTCSFSPYKLDKYIPPPRDNIKKHYFCEDFNESLVEMLVSEKKKTYV